MAIKPTAVINRMIRNAVIISYSPFYYIGREEF
jgi:hypothetical protein